MSSIVLRFLVDANTPNFGGKVQGGTVMKWIDEAGYACATSWAKAFCMTLYVGGIRFHRPVMVGDLVEVEARLAYTGTTSMGIAVEVRSGDVKGGPIDKTTDCVVVYVAVDSHGEPMPVDTWSPETPGEVAITNRVRAQIQAARAVV